MLSFALARLCWMPITLLGIALVTFLLLDLVPLDRAAAELRADGQVTSQERKAALHRLRVRYGLVDAKTGRERPVLQRFAAWLTRAVRLDLAPPGESPERFRARLLQALAISALLGWLALLTALGLGVPVGAWLGARAGSGADRGVSGLLLALSAVPEFLVATLLVLFVGGGLGPAWLPAIGLRAPSADSLGTVQRALDFAAHLVLPVTALAIVPTAVVARFLRESTARALRSEFIHALRGFGAAERTIRRAALRNALSPLWTLLGVLIPSLMTGAVVVEHVFAIPGFGRLTLDAVLRRDVATTMAATLIVATAVLVGLIVSDLLHRAADPRVEPT